MNQIDHLSIACGSLSVSIRVNFVKLTYNKVNSFKLVFLIESPPRKRGKAVFKER